MSYTLLTPDDRQVMLRTIGAKSIEELLTQIPADIRLRRELNLPPAMSEQELTTHVAALANMNRSAENAVCFLGGGAYDHFIPAVVDAVASRGEYYTAYTPYQAEASQGTLQVGLRVPDAHLRTYGHGRGQCQPLRRWQRGRGSGIDGVAVTDRPGKVLIAESVHPEYRLTLATYLKNLGTELITLPTPSGYVDPDVVKKNIDESTSCLVVQHPNFFGGLEEVDAIGKAVHDKDALFVVSYDPISLGIMKRPGDYGADIAVAEGQCLGNYMIYGGPYLGLLACRSEFVRKMPGRLVGQTTDRRGNRCWVLTLQAREQHIRREKATSNICTNQGIARLAAPPSTLPHSVRMAWPKQPNCAHVRPSTRLRS